MDGGVDPRTNGVSSDSADQKTIRVCYKNIMLYQ